MAGGSRWQSWLGLDRQAGSSLQAAREQATQAAMAILDVLPLPAFLETTDAGCVPNAAFRMRFGEPGPDGSARRHLAALELRKDLPPEPRPTDLHLADGGIFRIDATAPPGLPDSTIWMLTDMTAERRAADARAAADSAANAAIAERATTEKLRQSFYTTAPVAIAVLTRDGQVREVNRAFAHLCGLEATAFCGMALRELVAEAQRADFDKALADLGEDGADTTCEVTLARPDDPACRLVLRQVPDIGILTYALDTTQQRKLELRFAQTQKMMAVGQLAGGIAHDFNNLLTAMIGFSDLLLLRHTPGDPSFADIQQIRQNANRAANLVRQLLAFSRQQTLQPRVLVLTDVLADLASLLRRLLGANVELVMRHGRELGNIRVDQVQLEQVIMNLAVNARDAMPNGGVVTIRTDNAHVLPGTQPPGREVLAPGHYVVIEVVDTGTGIPPGIVHRIFEPFFSTKEVGAGTGLGLSTVYGIVKQTGGFIFVDSKLGEGTAFTIYLPRHDGRADAKKNADDDGIDLTGAGTVLLVEDEDAVRLFGARALRNKGYRVLEASAGDDALDMLEDPDETIDLLITDVVMPRMDGPTLITRAREARPGLRVICVSGYAEEAFRRRLEGMSDIHFLAKPFSLQQFAAKVKDVLR